MFIISKNYYFYLWFLSKSCTFLMQENIKELFEFSCKHRIATSYSTVLIIQRLEGYRCESAIFIFLSLYVGLLKLTLSVSLITSKEIDKLVSK